MRITVLTLFKEQFDSFLNTSIISRILEKELCEVKVVDIRDYSKDKHRHVDDTPYGGGAGMLMRVDVLADAIRANRNDDTYVLLTSPKAKPYEEKDAYRLLEKEDLMIVCGHYEGVDDRISDFIDENVSIGDYVLTGGELPAMVVMDSIMRLINEGISSESLKEESYTDGLLEYPQYTRPFNFEGKEVPFVLTNGNHKEIRRFNLKGSLRETYLYRKDLLEKRDLSKEEKELLQEVIDELEH
ncbi:MAG: tRNA (guanosine(37)-N1)-methyltransferase TrmD [Solobacterium sp.]|nr:tRNA (guanosine(37)-N1)-methyltransferase TrmD [Solobacterium sp.]MDY2953649.1 tRNA (guanosine(37)-N1)-methyltransferase TrmD [Erysipelotrichaceae bacterium]MCI6846370.1 tRNA (guanosine(37)-N1)-methyltransferase TrmD [Solobacterium sp.]MCI6878804.1 tRNA (guanosine(37)-N1)-methyltransferase TrmD [Solobacterium sp.]MCI7157431.1 tRNA (guanosine(37)-N1)-methyltransferase TrmD [Solobacterium sp.]